MEFLGGILMAFANSVPGVSGGTIAFLLGFFDEMIDSVNKLISKNTEKKDRKKAFFFLLRLGTAWVLGMVLAVIAVTAVFEKHIYSISSLFIGFIVFSIPLVVKEEKQTLKGKYLNALYIIPGCLFVVGITMLSSGELFSADSTLARCLLAIPAGALSICAMILPGISGSSLMMIFGLYLPLMEALRNIFAFEIADIMFIGCFAIGALIGALGFVKGVKFLLSRFRCQTVYVIFGMMLGSVYSIWVGPSTLDVPQDVMNFETFSPLFFILGGLFILLLEVLKYFIEKRKNSVKAKDLGSKHE